MEQNSKPKRQRAVRSEAIADQLESDIVEGLLPAGAKLDETAIAARFGVSRTPVREAFLTLTSRALAERVPYRGVIVCDLSMERVDAMFEAMGEIEALCGRLAAGRMTTAERAHLQELLARMDTLTDAGDFAGYERANTELHDAIYNGTHNSDLIDIAAAMRLKLAPFRRSQLQNRARMEQSRREHREIIDAILERDGSSAERHLRRHLLGSAKAFLAGRRAAAE
ncbi:GntR family transcriptional regulator [Aurantimonas sp. MSK8Z-1]|uniref:GntR family transcriptional regulator n=1 Tax=Mangrovibrevibacter kandeliae TaxID=2968473 RepID=UPI002118C501|nr:GntR family transcriptional regulator [Aurantimonas sp. MSK8Z-1]MCW4114106.1 GntR family transcriptional regulator [Aurantimonas sp. MSK8Z-1]